MKSTRSRAQAFLSRSLSGALVIAPIVLWAPAEALAAAPRGTEGGRAAIDQPAVTDLLRTPGADEWTVPGPAGLPESGLVARCDRIRSPSGEIVLVGPGCSPGAPSPSGPGPGGSAPAEAELQGCPYEYFPESEWFATETRFALPVADHAGRIAPEPFVFHFDHEREEGESVADCVPFAPGHLCYDGHEGTDFMLNGGFLAMDNANIEAVAAARGVVMSVEDGNFDRCSVDTEPLQCEWKANPSFGKTICRAGICFPDLSPGSTVCVPNPTFLEVICDDGDGLEIENPNRVDICHPDGTISSYLHLMKGTIPEEIQVGAEVDCGDSLGLLGSSGRSSGPHLHFHVKVLDPETGEDVYADPYSSDPAESLWVQQSGSWDGLPSPACQ